MATERSTRGLHGNPTVDARPPWQPNGRRRRRERPLAWRRAHPAAAQRGQDGS
jgi:hypothetical protein